MVTKSAQAVSNSNEKLHIENLQKKNLQEERNTLEAALRSRDKLKAEIAKMEKEHEAEIAKISHSSNINLTQLKMQNSSANTSIVLEKKKAAKKIYQMQTELDE
ncbi:MAG: hypothetical protein SGCHY_005178, partial [Lobulomycetales sp.]